MGPWEEAASNAGLGWRSMVGLASRYRQVRSRAGTASEGFLEMQRTHLRPRRQRSGWWRQWATPPLMQHQCRLAADWRPPAEPGVTSASQCRAIKLLVTLRSQLAGTERHAVGRSGTVTQQASRRRLWSSRLLAWRSLTDSHYWSLQIHTGAWPSAAVSTNPAPQLPVFSLCGWSLAPNRL